MKSAARHSAKRTNKLQMMHVPPYLDLFYIIPVPNMRKLVMIPARFAPIAFGFVLSCLMSLIVSGVATFRNAGFVRNFPELWIHAWVPSWIVAFPIVLIVAPITRRIVIGLVKA